MTKSQVTYRKAAVLLLLYLVAATVAWVWLAFAYNAKSNELDRLNEQVHTARLCDLEVVECEGEIKK